jgi:hypothetical protein
MHTASFVGFIRMLFYFFAFYYISKFIIRLLLPFIIKKAIEKTANQFQNNQYNNRQDNSWSKSVREDNISYKKPEDKKTNSSNTVGEYVDYEEID